MVDIRNLNLLSITPFPNAYAHNDSVYNNPLTDVLQLGFSYIEADVHLIKNEIYVSHRRPFFLKKSNTLTNLYLQPLSCLFEKNGNWIFPKSLQPIHLVIDIKTEAEATLAAIKKAIQPFEAMLSYVKFGHFHPRAVTIILSGNRPIESILSQTKSYLLLDGRIEDIGKKIPSQIMPLISDDYRKIFSCSFFRKNPTAAQLELLRQKANAIHQEGKLFRLWKIPERESVWELLLENGLDVLSTDRVRKLVIFLRNMVLRQIL